MILGLPISLHTGDPTAKSCYYSRISAGFSADSTKGKVKIGGASCKLYRETKEKRSDAAAETVRSRVEPRLEGLVVASADVAPLRIGILALVHQGQVGKFDFGPTELPGWACMYTIAFRLQRVEPRR